MISHTSTEQLKLYSHQLRERSNVNSEAVEARRSFFTSFGVIVDGVLGREANYLLKIFADKLLQNWKNPYSQIMLSGEVVLEWRMVQVYLPLT